MNNQQDIIVQRLDAQEAKLNAIYESTEKTRKYFLWTLIISIAMVVLPLIGLFFAIPFAMHSLSVTLGSSALSGVTETMQDITDEESLMREVTDMARLLK